MIDKKAMWAVGRLFLITLLTLIAVNLFLFYRYFHKPHLFDNCQEAHNIGVSNIPKSSPLYRQSLDEDNNGIACAIMK